MSIRRKAVTRLEKIVDQGKQTLAEKKALNDEAAVDFAGVAITLGGAVVAIMVVVILCGNLETATAGTINESSVWYTLLSTVSTYGSTGVTLLAVGLIVMGAMAILWILR